MQVKLWRNALTLALLSPLALGTAFGQEKAPAPEKEAAATPAAPAQVMEDRKSVV